jgi:MarR-like DNA-binding transcriptional regulator SgrR of sgrS sRNA
MFLNIRQQARTTLLGKINSISVCWMSLHRWQILTKGNSLAQCEDLLIKQMPIIPIFHYNMLFASHGNLKDMILSSLGNLDFKWAYIEDKDL